LATSTRVPSGSSTSRKELGIVEEKQIAATPMIPTSPDRVRFTIKRTVLIIIVAPPDGVSFPNCTLKGLSWSTMEIWRRWGIFWTILLNLYRAKRLRKVPNKMKIIAESLFFAVYAQTIAHAVQR
jgi:hypothetical protein